MKILVDTHIFIWILTGSDRLTKKILEQLNHADSVYLSSISITEIIIKCQIGKLKINVNEAVQNLAEIGIKELPYTISHACALQNLPFIHKDPFDRMLVSQAISEPLKFLTADKILAEYSELVEVV
ncbi:MAG: type II toxin-antitoxin system VapC family toxin [Bdellovibrionota bacterium]